MISEEFARQQVNRMQGLPYFGKIGQHGYAELVSVLVRTAKDEREAAEAISTLLTDETRSGDREKERVPTPGELRQWVLAQRGPEVEQPAPGDGRHCDRCRNGRPPGWVMTSRLSKGNYYEFWGKCPNCNPNWYGSAQQ